MKNNVLLVATRSPDKLREIRQILADLPGVEILGLHEAGIPEQPEEDALEQHSGFEDNALAKARFFAARSGLLTLADDSGLCVDALDGAPGVWSKRFCGRVDLSGAALDVANNELLVRRLEGVEPDERTAHYVCAVALVDPTGSTSVYRGTCEGIILDAQRGSGGFGYDPLFFLPSEDATFGELPPERKNELSHRARAVRSAAPAIAAALDPSAASR
jgi:XTP/dITP diphosphohydrolase